MKKLYSILSLNVLLLATGALHAQTLNISPNPLNITTQVNTGATAQLSFTSTGTAITIYSIVPTVSWLHSHWEPAATYQTPQTPTITVDSLAASATPYAGSLSVFSSDSVSIPQRAGQCFSQQHWRQSVHSSVSIHGWRHQPSAGAESPR